MVEVKKMANNDREIEELQNNLETLRKLFGWTAEQLGDRLGITKQSVLNLEKGPNRGGVKMSKIQYIAIRAIFEAEANSRKGEEKENLLTVLGLVFNNNPEITSEQRQSALDTAKVVSSATVSGNKDVAIKTMSTALMALGVGAGVVAAPLAGGAIMAGTLSAWVAKMLKDTKKDEKDKKGGKS